MSGEGWLLVRAGLVGAPRGGLELLGTWKRFQRSSQSSGTSVPLTTTRTPPTSASPCASSGSSPGAP